MIRLAVDLADPDVWIATHRLGGKLFVLAGAVWIVAGATGFFGPRATPVLVAILLGCSLAPVTWSYVL